MIKQVNLDMDEYRGKSTDTKPSGIANGTTFLEIDTGAKYMYDEENEQWCIMPSGSGGGGGENTEVISARTGADGTRYGSLKGRLDAENEDLNDKIDGEISLVKSHLGAVEIVDTASGAIATFPDGSDGVPVESLTVSMEPIQDLHGQDAPYPGGGGKNLLPTPTQETQTVNGVTVKANDDGSITFSGTASTSTSINFVFFDLAAGDYILSNIGSNAASSGEITSIYVRDNTNGVTLTSFSLGNSVNNTVFTLTETVNIRFYAVVQSGATVSGTLYPMIRRSGNGDNTFAPYSNICPISGRQIVKVTRTGVNVWDEEWETGAYNVSGKSWGESYWRCKNPLNVVTGERYFIKRPSSTLTIYLYGYDSNMGNGTSLSLQSDSSLLIPSGVNKVGFFFLKSAYGEIYNHDISINYPATDHDYHPGTVASVEVQLGQTVYGGTVDAVSGVLTVDMAYYAITNDTELALDSSYTDFSRFNIVDGTGRLSGKPSGAIISNLFKPGTLVVNGVFMHGTTGTINFTPSISIGTTIPEIKAWMIANNAAFCYELAEPVTITLTPEQLTTVLGTNNIWSDADSVSVDYVADTKLYIEQLTEPDADMVADANITSGQYFMVGNALFLATANIASGGTISPGVNCTRTSLAEALNAINA